MLYTMAAPTINFNQFLEKEKLKNDGCNYTDWIRHVRIVLNAGMGRGRTSSTPYARPSMEVLSDCSIGRSTTSTTRSNLVRL